MSVISRLKLLVKLRDKEYRDAYVEEKVTTSLPFQIRALREQREWSQAELGNHADMRQNAISRLEDAENGTPSISTLLRLARAFDVALLVKFVPFSKLLDEFKDLSSDALEVPSFEKEMERLQQPAIAASATTNFAMAAETASQYISEGLIRSEDLHTLSASLRADNSSLFISQDSTFAGATIKSTHVN